MNDQKYWDCTVTKGIMPLLKKTGKITSKNTYTIREFEFLKEYADGTYKDFCSEGVHMSYIDAKLKKDIHIEGKKTFNSLILSFLINGELLIQLDKNSSKIICENQESCMAYLTEADGYCTYNKCKQLKELKIRLSPEFLKKHLLLDENEDIKDVLGIATIQEKGSIPFSIKTEEIITEILSAKFTDNSKRLFIESKILELLAIQINENITAHKELISNDMVTKKIYEVERIIGADLTALYSIQQLTKLVSLNEFVLKKEFKRIFKKTIFDYTLSLKMKKAMKLLIHTNKPIYEISDSVGYKNPTHFTAAFKKLNDCTPKKYRTNVKTVLPIL